MLHLCPAQLRGEQPSYLKGDNFFKFICFDCSEDRKESFERMRLTWQQVRSCCSQKTNRGPPYQTAYNTNLYVRNKQKD